MSESTYNRPAPARSTRWIRNLAREVVIHIVLVIISIMWVLPMVWMISTSLKEDTQIFTWPPEWIPRPFDFQNYPEAISYIPLLLYARNTLFVAMGAVAGTIVSCPMVAYGLARIPWKGANVLMVITLATMMLPFQVVMIPLFVTFRKLGWINSWKPLIVPQRSRSTSIRPGWKG